jgi:hypothetical protein
MLKVNYDAIKIIKELPYYTAYNTIFCKINDNIQYNEHENRILVQFQMYYLLFQNLKGHLNIL